MRCIILGVFLVLMAGQIQAATSAAERREQLAQIREYMADPDPLMRLAYLEELAARKDQTATMLALRFAMASDDKDLRAVAMRLYIANAKSLDLKINMSEDLKKAADAKDAKKRLSNQLQSLLNLGYFRFDIDQFDFTSASFEVFAMNGVAKRDEKYAGAGQVRGSSVTFSTIVYPIRHGSYDQEQFKGKTRCTVTLQPNSELQLIGEAACDTGRAYPTVSVSMPMF